MNIAVETSTLDNVGRLHLALPYTSNAYLYLRSGKYDGSTAFAPVNIIDQLSFLICLTYAALLNVINSHY